MVEHMNFTITPIGIIHSPFKQKFAIPRQSSLCDKAKGQLELLKPFDDTHTLRGIEQYSHLWISFIFHKNIKHGWSNLVRPPRLGGNEKLGVFATRSTFRPNPIGLSAVKFLGITKTDKKIFLDIEGIDLLDGTPVVDIKPYLPYADCITDATAGFAHTAPASPLKIIFTSQAQKQCDELAHDNPDFVPLLNQILSQDPRPAYKKHASDSCSKNIQEYAVYLYDFNIRWKVELNTCTVFSIEKTSPNKSG